MAVAHVQVPAEQIAEFCRRNGIRRLSLFGSALTPSFSDSSDVDLLVEFEPDRRVGFLKMAAMERELSGLLGRRVDLRTPEELSRYFREDVVKSAVVQYVRQ
jgi:predicted nucleotidyltransferase